MDAAPAYIGAGVASVIAIVSAIVSYVRSVTSADVQIKAMRDEIDAMKEHPRMVGESLVAMRQKVTDVEIWNRDNFVRRADFASTVDSINRNIDSLRQSIESKLDRMEDKIDKIKTDA